MKNLLISIYTISLFFIGTSLQAQTRFDLVVIFKPSAKYADIKLIKTLLNATQIDSSYPSRALLWRCSLTFPTTLIIPKLGGGTYSRTASSPYEAASVVCGSGQSEGVSNNEQYVIPQTDMRESSQTPNLFGNNCNANETDAIVTAKPGKRAVKIAILDSGIDCDKTENTIKIAHDSLKSFVHMNPENIDGTDSNLNGYIDDLIGYDFVNNTGVPKDSSGHGTFVAGVVSRILKQNKADNIKFLVLKVLDAKNSGSEFNFIRAIDYAIKEKVEVINCSFVSSAVLLDTMQPLSAAIQTASEFGVLFSLAAGNNGKDIDQTKNWYGPAAFQNNNTIVTGATACLDSMTSFTNFAKKNVDIFTLGKGLSSTWIRSSVCATNCYAVNTGTSFAAPQTTAIAALLSSNLVATDWQKVKCSILKSTTFKGFLTNKSRKAGILNGSKAHSILDGNNAPCDEITTVKRSESTRIFETFPNPFGNIVTVDFTLQQSSEVKISVFDLTGSLISQNRFDGILGSNQYSLSIEDNPGVYFIHIHTGKDTLIKKVVKTPY